MLWRRWPTAGWTCWTRGWVDDGQVGSGAVLARRHALLWNPPHRSADAQTPAAPRCRDTDACSATSPAHHMRPPALYTPGARQPCSPFAHYPPRCAVQGVDLTDEELIDHISEMCVMSKSLEEYEGAVGRALLSRLQSTASG